MTTGHTGPLGLPPIGPWDPQDPWTPWDPLGPQDTWEIHLPFELQNLTPRNFETEAQTKDLPKLCI